MPNRAPYAIVPRRIPQGLPGLLAQHGVKGAPGGCTDAGIAGQLAKRADGYASPAKRIVTTSKRDAYRFQRRPGRLEPVFSGSPGLARGWGQKMPEHRQCPFFFQKVQTFHEDEGNERRGARNEPRVASVLACPQVHAS